MGLVAPRHVGSSQTRARTRVLCIGRQILNHCTTREALTNYFCMNLACGIVSRRSSPYPRSSRFSHMLSSKNFIVLYFTFMSVIHFELIFVKGVKSVSRFILLHVEVQLFHHHLLIKTVFFFSLLYCLCSFVKDQLTVFMWVCFWAYALYSVLLTYLSILSSIVQCLDYYSFIVSLEVREYQSHDVVLQYRAGCSGFLPLHIKLRIGVLISTK